MKVYNFSKILLIELLIENLPPLSTFKLILFLTKNIILECNKYKNFFFNKIKWYFTINRLTIIIYEFYFPFLIFYPNYLIYILNNILNKVLIKISSIFKSISWNNNNKFIRPIRNILLLVDDKILKTIIYNIITNKYTYTNNINKQKISIIHPLKYYSLLYHNRIIVDFSIRKKVLLNQLILLTQKYNIKINNDNNNLNYLILLIEWPIIIIGNYNKKYLTLPIEILMYVINNIQKCIYTYTHTKLFNNLFIIVSNYLLGNLNYISKSYNYVINNKLDEINRFIKDDKQLKLINFLPKLKNINFITLLGSYFNKLIRHKQIICWLYYYLNLNNKLSLIKLINICYLVKCDYSTKLVAEYPEFHGLAGMIYIKNLSNLSKTFKDYYYHLYILNNNLSYNKYYQYRNLYIALILLAEYIDTIIGILIIDSNYLNNIKQDPFGLRKIANNIGKIIIFNEININLLDLINQSIYIYSFNRKININNHSLLKLKSLKIVKFIINRYFYKFTIYESIYKKIINAIINNEKNKFNILVLNKLKTTIYLQFNYLKFKNLIIINKRINKLLNKQTILSNITSSTIKINFSLFSKSEQHLYLFINKIHKNLNKYYYLQLFNKFFKQLYKLINPINNFFNNTYILQGNNLIIKNRLYLLIKIKKLINKFINLSLL